MNKQQLYINGVAVDMPTDQIKIKVESNLFSDADKVMTAHSYNIALPRTMTNDNIFALAYVPAAETGGKSTHRYLSASLFVDGVPLFRNGFAVLTSVDGKGYNLNLFWGLLGVFDEIKREGLKLNELPLSVHWQESYAVWRRLARNNTPFDAPYDSCMDGAMLAQLDDESRDVVNYQPWWMPSDSATHILSLIASVYGITWGISTEAQQRIGTLEHVLTTLKVKAKDEVARFTVRSVFAQITTNRYYINWGADMTGVAPHQGMITDAVQLYTTGSTVYYVARNGIHTDTGGIHLKSVRVHGYRKTDDWRIVFPSASNNVVEVTPTYNAALDRYEIDYTWYDTQVDASEPLPMIAHSTDGVAQNATDIYMDVEIDEIADLTTIEGGNWWWEFTRNLPDIKVLDYISEVLAHTGCVIVGSVTERSAVRIVTLDEVAQAAPVSYEAQAVESITMSLDDLAQKNIYKHKANDDDEQQGLPDWEADGVIYTNDYTLEVERDAFSSHFKVPRTNKVPHYKIERNEDGTYKATWHDAGDYILGSRGLLPYNTGQDFASTIGSYYTQYERMVARPKEVEVVMRLSVLDLLTFDFERPVYINQLGRKYMIKTLESDQGDNYKFTLIQM